MSRHKSYPISTFDAQWKRINLELDSKGKATLVGNGQQVVFKEATDSAHTILNEILIEYTRPNNGEFTHGDTITSYVQIDKTSLYDYYSSYFRLLTNQTASTDEPRTAFS